MTLIEKNLEKYESWFACLLIRKMSRELIVGPVKSAAVFSNEGKPENVL